MIPASPSENSIRLWCSKLYQICSGSSSYDCEVAAIFMALNFVFQSNLSHTQLLIVSDSLSSLLAKTEPPYDRNICPTIPNTPYDRNICPTIPNIRNLL